MSDRDKAIRALAEAWAMERNRKLIEWFDEAERQERLAREATWHECLDRHSFYSLAHLMQSLVLDGESAISDRKVQLFNVACARHVEYLFPNDLCRRTISLAEQASDDVKMRGLPLATYQEIKAVMDEYGPAPDFFPRPPFDPLTEQAYELAAELADPEQVGARVRYMGSHAARCAAIATGNLDSNPEADYQVAIYREIFGNLFRKIELPPDWRTDTAVSLAQQMYESRDFSAMPILADALQDAGCDNADILAHCRDTTQIHVRGCWVVDLVLGKS